MKISILTLFPDMFRGPFDASIIKRASEKGIVDIRFINIRDFATDSYKTVDDHPYGGGAGMILRVDVIDRALASVIPAKAGIHQDGSPNRSGMTTRDDDNSRTILLDPAGQTYTQKKAREFSRLDHLILVCGHYEGIDERIRTLVDEEISIGDFVLTGGEIPAMAIVDSVVRLLPGTLKKPEAPIKESFSEGAILEYPQYTRPPEYNGMKVPDIVISGDHAKIEAWQKEQAIIRTRKRRPDLLQGKRIRPGHS